METVAAGPITRLGRLGYRIASALITADRRIRRSHGRGVKMIVSTEAGDLLLVSHSYGNRAWTFPGGGVRRGEDPMKAAGRELEEELGIKDEPLQLLGTYPARPGRRHEVVSVARVVCDPASLKARPIEIAAFDWVTARSLPTPLDPEVQLALGLLAGHRAELAAARHRTA